MSNDLLENTKKYEVSRNCYIARLETNGLYCPILVDQEEEARGLYA